jgi:hypothetical protein
VLAGAVGFDHAAVDRLTAALFLDLVLQLFQEGRRMRFTSSLGWGWRWGARPSMAGSGFAPTHRARGRARRGS